MAEINYAKVHMDKIFCHMSEQTEHGPEYEETKEVYESEHKPVRQRMPLEVTLFEVNHRENEEEHNIIGLHA